MYLHVSRPGPAPAGTLISVPDSIVDYEVLEPWGEGTGRFVCRPPDRLGWPGPVLVTELAVDAEGCDQLIRLNSAAGAGMVQAIELGPDLATGGVFVATEHPEGGSLARPTAPLDTAARRRAVEAAARAADALHEMGLAHGAIHRGTVLMAERGALLDLPCLDAPAGEAIHVASWPELEAVDPEVLGGEAPSRASDIWAIGATLHHALSDRPLYPGIDADQPVTAVQRVMFTRPQVDRAIRSSLVELIEACLAVDPADRPARARDVADRLAAEGAT